MKKTPALDALQFIPLGLEHLDAVTELEHLIFSTPWSKEQYSALLVNGSCKLFGVTSSGKLLGYMAVSMLEITGELEIYNIAVLPEARRKGLAKKMLTLVLSVAGKLGLERGILEVRAGNTAAINLYEGLGFTRCGKRSAYYTGPVEDALLYEYKF